VLGILVAAAAALVASRVFRSHVVDVDVGGAAGTKFTGTATIDGTKRDLSGVVPAHFALEGKNAVSFVVELPEADVSVEMKVAGEGRGKTGAGSPAPTYVSGDVEFTAFTTAWHIGGSNRPPQSR